VDQVGPWHHRTHALDTLPDIADLPIGGLDWSDIAQEAGSHPCHPAPKAGKPLLLMDLPYVGREGSNSQRLFPKHCKWHTWPRLAIPKKNVCENCYPPCSCGWQFIHFYGRRVVRFVGCKWSFYPGGMAPYFFPHSTKSILHEFRGGFLWARPGYD
jgi:hypothetical protein